MKNCILIPIFCLLLFGTWSVTGVQAAQTASGYVYLDTNHNGVRDSGEKGINGVCVSNGREVVITNVKGKYELPVDRDTVIFVIKPRDYMFPVDDDNLPKFYYVHQPNGSPRTLLYPGIEPTGPLPEAVDFPLLKHPEKDKFEVILFGDPQPNELGDIYHFAHDIVPELIGCEASFGVCLGDLMADILDLYEPFNDVVGTIGIPFFNVPGNHDMNLDVPNDALANETWKRVFGPPTYSFNWGPVHFIVLDDVIYQGEGNSYSAGFNQTQLDFIANDLKHVPHENLIVLMMHIPLLSTNYGDLFYGDLFALLKDRPHTLSFAGHTHDIEHVFFGKEQGWYGAKPHHSVIAGATCGIHWLGVKDEYGIPAAMTHCGSPNGYVIATFNGNKYKLRFKAPRRPVTDQMHIFAPNQVKASETADTEVMVNVFFGSEFSRTEMKIDRTCDWVEMPRIVREDPYLQKVISPEHPLSQVAHIWVAKLPANLTPGGHVINIRTTDMFGQKYIASRVIRVE